jgi:rod shape-determining protein MreD
MANLSYTSGEQVEVYSFRWPVAICVPVLAILLQAFIPVHLYYARVFDLPLLVTIFFAISRRSPVSGLLTGAAIGLAQDCLMQYPLGLCGMAKTVVGYMASSLGVRIDVENRGTRFLITLIFFAVHQLIYLSIAHGMAGVPLIFNPLQQAGMGIANAMIAVFLFAVLDRFKQKI